MALNILSGGKVGVNRTTQLINNKGLKAWKGFKPFIYRMPGARIELAQRQAPRDFKSIAVLR